MQTGPPQGPGPQAQREGLRKHVSHSVTYKRPCDAGDVPAEPTRWSSRPTAVWAEGPDLERRGTRCTALPGSAGRTEGQPPAGHLPAGFLPDSGPRLEVLTLSPRAAVRGRLPLPHRVCRQDWEIHVSGESCHWFPGTEGLCLSSGDRPGCHPAMEASKGGAGPADPSCTLTLSFSFLSFYPHQRTCLSFCLGFPHCL